MTCEQLQSVLPEYWTGTISPATRADVETHLAACAECRAEADALSRLWQQLDVLGDEDPSTDVQARFDAMLAAWREGASARVVPFPKRLTSWRPGPLGAALLAAAAVLLVVTGFAAGRLWPNEQASREMAELRGELRSMREVVAVSLLQQQSASERLRGVTWSHQIDQPGDEIIDALLGTLLHDSNVNVRLAAIDALRQFGRTAQVRRGLIDAVTRQESPLVQVELVDLLVELRERGSKDALRALADNERADQVVRERARWGLTQMAP